MDDVYGNSWWHWVLLISACLGCCKYFSSLNLDPATLPGQFWTRSPYKRLNHGPGWTTFANSTATSVDLQEMDRFNVLVQCVRSTDLRWWESFVKRGWHLGSSTEPRNSQQQLLQFRAGSWHQPSSGNPLALIFSTSSGLALQALARQTCPGCSLICFAFGDNELEDMAFRIRRGVSFEIKIGNQAHKKPLCCAWVFLWWWYVQWLGIIISHGGVCDDDNDGADDDWRWWQDNIADHMIKTKHIHCVNRSPWHRCRWCRLPRFSLPWWPWAEPSRAS